LLLTSLLVSLKQRDLLFVAASERCSKKEAYQPVREKWGLKCNDAIYGKVLQLLTLAVYVTQDLRATAATTTTAAAAGGDTDGTEGHATTAEASTVGTTAQQTAARALERFACEECFLPSSEDALTALMFTSEGVQEPGAKMPCLLHVLLDIYYANDPLDASSKHWVFWLVDQLCSLSQECAQSAAKYRLDNGITPAESEEASDASGTPAKSPATAKASAASNKALSARDKAMEAMKAKAAQFMLMMGDDTDSDEDDESDADKGDKGGKKPAGDADGVGDDSGDEGDAAPERQGVKSSEKVVSVRVRGEGKSAAPVSGAKAGALKSVPTGREAPLSAAMEVASPAEGSHSSEAATPVPSADVDEEAPPVCIICQADANAEDSTGNIRVLGYLALVQASKLLTHDCVDCGTGLHVLDNLPIIPAKALPKRTSRESNVNVSFCGHSKSADVFVLTQ
jgi:alkylhydroperoxidase/carboxymuconolactone decarboxylase family protein YurZ